MPSLPKRTRASKPKVHTGCRTCKTRRVKCDEGKPSCVRCTSTSRVCEGYPQLKPLAVRQRRLAPAEIAEQLDRDSSQPLIPLGGAQRKHQIKPKDVRAYLASPIVDTSQIDLTSHERWFLDFFRRVTAKTNATYFNKEFWGTLVHQASEIQPAVRHAAIGIGSLHWGGMMKDNCADAGQIASFSLRQCNKALEHMQQNITADIARRPRMETVLISCGILIAFSFSQGDARAGGSHLHAGYSLLRQWQRVGMDKSPVGTVILGSLYQLQLDWPSLVDHDPSPKSYSFPLQLASEYQSAVVIEKPEEACGALLILGWLALQMKPQLSTGSFAESTPSAVLQRLQDWKQLILQRGQPLSQEKLDTIAILDVWSEILLIKSLSDDRIGEGEMRYDYHSSRFQRTIQQVRVLLAQESFKNSWVRAVIVTPLFFCAYKCRDWKIRREALGLLSGWSSEPGVWSISKPSLVLDRLIKIESEGYQPGETIPESARIDAVRVEFVSGETEVRFWHRRPLRLDRDSSGNLCHTWVWDCEVIPY